MAGRASQSYHVVHSIPLISITSLWENTTLSYCKSYITLTYLIKQYILIRCYWEWPDRQKKMSAFIKPAVPNSSTVDKVTANTNAWLNNNINILSLHYKQALEQLLSRLPTFSKVSLNKAISYGFSRYKKNKTANSSRTLFPGSAITTY